jgi:hypothetical protein
MKKHLTLSLDNLQVESFLTTSLPEDANGTVRAYITGTGCGNCPNDSNFVCTGQNTCLALCTAQCPPQSIPCTIQALTCPGPTQQQTCQQTCTVQSQHDTCQLSCRYFDCNPTCDFQTQCW